MRLLVSRTRPVGEDDSLRMLPLVSDDSACSMPSSSWVTVAAHSSLAAESLEFSICWTASFRATSEHSKHCLCSSSRSSESCTQEAKTKVCCPLHTPHGDSGLGLGGNKGQDQSPGSSDHISSFHTALRHLQEHTLTWAQWQYDRPLARELLEDSFTFVPNFPIFKSRPL